MLKWRPPADSVRLQTNIFLNYLYMTATGYHTNETCISGDLVKVVANQFSVVVVGYLLA